MIRLKADVSRVDEAPVVRIHIAQKGDDVHIYASTAKETQSIAIVSKTGFLLLPRLQQLWPDRSPLGGLFPLSESGHICAVGESALGDFDGPDGRIETGW